VGSLLAIVIHYHSAYGYNAHTHADEYRRPRKILRACKFTFYHPIFGAEGLEDIYKYNRKQRHEQHHHRLVLFCEHIFGKFLKKYR
jgi:hypothetical protein